MTFPLMLPGSTKKFTKDDFGLCSFRAFIQYITQTGGGGKAETLFRKLAALISREGYSPSGIASEDCSV